MVIEAKDVAFRVRELNKNVQKYSKKCHSVSRENSSLTLNTIFIVSVPRIYIFLENQKTNGKNNVLADYQPIASLLSPSGMSPVSSLN